MKNIYSVINNDYSTSLEEYWELSMWHLIVIAILMLSLILCFNIQLVEHMTGNIQGYQFTQLWNGEK